MSQYKIPIFDYLRTLAIVGIVFCHFCFNWAETMGIGRFCASTFNALFIGLSGLLLGLGWHNKGRCVLGFQFLYHRFSKLIKTYYPFLLLMFLFLKFVADYPLQWKDVIMHLLFLPWFDKLPGFGHLWFMTMIAICYVSASLVSRFPSIIMGGVKMAFLLIAVYVAHAFLLVHGLSGQMILYLAFFLLCFYRANYILRWINKQSTKQVIIIGLPVIVAIALLFHLGLYDRYRQIGEWLGTVAATMIAILILKVGHNAKSNATVSFIAGISFEIYLVHHNFAFDRYSVMVYLNNAYLGFFVLLIGSVLVAYLLKKLVSYKNDIYRIYKFF